jgi:hypothetical protein
MKTIICVSIAFVGFTANVARANYLSPSQDAKCEGMSGMNAQCNCYLQACNAAYGAGTQAAMDCVTVDSGSTDCSPV